MFSGKQFFVILFGFVASSGKMGRTIPTAHLLSCLQAYACCYAEVDSIPVVYLDYSCVPS